MSTSPIPPTPVTIDDIYRLFDRSQAEADRSRVEFDRRLLESKDRVDDIYRLFDRSQAEADRSRVEFDRRLLESKDRVDDIYRLFDRSQAEADRSRVEFDRSRAEFDRSLAESKTEFDRSLAESRAEFDRSLAESRAEFDRSLAESKAEADRQLSEIREEERIRSIKSDRRHREVEKIAAQAMRSVEGLSSRWGRFVENMVEPAIVRLFQERNIEVKETHTRVKAKRGNVKMEIDILAVDDTVAVAVEVKSRLTQKQINDFIQRLAQFKTAFPAYAHYQVYGAIAAIEIDEGADIYAYNQGLFMIKQSGEMVQIENDPDFSPVVW